MIGHDFELMKFPTNIFAIFLLVFAIAEVGCAFYSVFYYFRLLSYLKKENYSRWQELTSIGKFGPGLNNAFRTIPYLYNALDNKEEKVARYKGKIRIEIVI